jgi:hypothetical protein
MRIELYKVVIDSEAYHWTSSDTAFDHDGDTYEPDAIGRGDMVQGDEINRQNVQIRVPFDNPVAAVFLADTPDVVATVTIFRVEDADTDANRADLLEGPHRRHARRGAADVLECESVFTSMRRTGARARYQVQCRHALYGTACGVDKAATQWPARCLRSRRHHAHGDGCGRQGDGYFVGGMIEFGGVFRFIVGHTGTTIRLWREMPDSRRRIGDAVSRLQPDAGRVHERFNNAATTAAFPGCRPPTHSVS